MTAPDFSTVTEMEGQRISVEQLDRTCHRYRWASGFTQGAEVLEVACGAGQGLGLLARGAKRLSAGDISPPVLAVAQKTYGKNINFGLFGAESLPFADASLDVILLFEAIYYVDAGLFFAEARRVLRTGGKVLIATANPALADFNPSPYSKTYFDSAGLAKLAASHGFEPQLSGYIDILDVSLRQKLLRPVKRAAVALNLMPRTMQGKELLKKLYFGKMTVMPRDITAVPFVYHPPTPLQAGEVDQRHKVIYCSATKKA